MKSEITTRVKSSGPLQRDFLSFFKAYRNYVFSIALSISKNSDVAQDITQDVFIKFLENKARFPEGSQEEDLKKILRRICINHTINVMKKNQRRQHHERNSFKENIAWLNPTDTPFDNQRLHQHLNQLDDKFRRPLLMRYFEGKKYSSIAQDLRLPITTVQSRVRKGLHLLQSRLKKEGFLVTLPIIEGRLGPPHKNFLDREDRSGFKKISEKFQDKLSAIGQTKIFLFKFQFSFLILLASLPEATTRIASGPSVQAPPTLKKKVSGKNFAFSLKRHTLKPIEKPLSSNSKQVEKAPKSRDLPKNFTHDPLIQTKVIKNLTRDWENEGDKNKQVHSPNRRDRHLAQDNKRGQLGENNKLPPVARAGPDQKIYDNEGDNQELVFLDGSGSYDPDGSDPEDLKCLWFKKNQLIAIGARATVSLPLGIHDITLLVTDEDSLTAADTLQVTVAPPTNNFPKAVATYSVESGDSGNTVLLDASSSSDEDLDMLTYTWTEVTDPNQPQELYHGAVPTVLVELEGGEHTFELTVTDNGTPPLAAHTILSFTLEKNPGAHQTPVALATFEPGSVILVEAFQKGQVVVDASSSYDLDGVIVAYVWSLTSLKTGKENELPWLSASPIGGVLDLDVGEYHLTLCVIDDDGLKDTQVYPLTVTLGSPPVAKISASVKVDFPLDGLDAYIIDSYDFLYFDAWSSSDLEGTDLDYTWEYQRLNDDSWELGSTDPTYDFSSTDLGLHQIRLQVRDAQGNLSEYDTIYVWVQ